MASSRIYAVATGQCLVRGPEPVSEGEGDRIRREYHGGVQLVFDAPRDEIRGFVPIRRRSPEAFYAVVSLGRDDQLRAETFYDAVSAVVDAHDRWQVRTEVPEGELFRTSLEDGIDADRWEANVGEIRNALAERRSEAGPVVVGVDTVRGAVSLANTLKDSLLDDERLVVASERSLDAIDATVVVWVREQSVPLRVIDAAIDDDKGTTGEDGPTDPSGANDTAGFDRWRFLSPVTVALVVSGLVGGAAVALGIGVEVSSVAVSVLFLAATALLWLWEE